MTRAHKVGLVVGLTILVALCIAGYLVIGANSRPSRLDEPFARLRVGMTAAEVEAVLGPSGGPNPTADQVIVAGFDDVDTPPLAEALSEPRYWYDGKRRRVRVYFKAGKLWQGKLNQPGHAGRYLR